MKLHRAGNAGACRNAGVRGGEQAATPETQTMPPPTPRVLEHDSEP